MYIERNLRSLTGIPRRRVRSNGSETIKQSLVKWMICKNVRHYLFHFSLFALKLKVSPERLEGGRGEVGGICVSRYYTTLHYTTLLPRPLGDSRWTWDVGQSIEFHLVNTQSDLYRNAAISDSWLDLNETNLATDLP